MLHARLASRTAFSHSAGVSDVTHLLEAIHQGDACATEELLRQVYGELRQMAAHKMAREGPGHTLQATALVHEAWMRLVNGEELRFAGRAHFFAAAAEAMRRILIESARRRHRLKRGSDPQRENLEILSVTQEQPSDEMLAVDEALDELAAEDQTAASLVKLRYFVGMTMEEAATALGIPLRSAERLWAYARAWLRRRMDEQ
jgi:RNA polymerase sigma factor (TIGR02999 family)